MTRHSRPGTAGRMDAASIRKLNAALILDVLRGKGLVSRAELARLTGLTKPTISMQVAGMIERGVVVEDGAGAPDARGGKPPVLLRFNQDWGCLAAAEINSASVRVWLADLNGRTFDDEASPVTPELGAGHILDVLLASLRQVLKRSGQGQKLCSIAIAAPGRVDPATGTVLEAGNVFHWRNVDVKKRVEDNFGVPVAVDNDVNFAALGEMHSGLAAGVENFILIRHGTGIGAGLVIGGRLYQGSHFAAGEIGHLILDRMTMAPEVLTRGLLETAVGSDRVREKVLAAWSGQAGVPTPEPGADLAAELAALLRHGDESASLVLDEVASQMSIAVADMAAMLDPELIVLAGDLFALIAGRIRELVGRVIPWPMRIELSALGADAALMGAMGSARGLARDLIYESSRETARLPALR
ncbi:MAG: ROK family protein [Bryobacteraceae bacterium]|nr:ROK family protein [Bryobacteraceae bacterium]